jgi:two-component system phosphate regulon sensor histidine kinase PhoR
MFDEDGCLSMLNPAAQQLFAGDVVQIGLPLARGNGNDALLEALEQAYTSGKSYAREMTWSDKRVFNALFTPIPEGGCVVVLHDVTHFKELEKMKNGFVATASHDLRNPLTTIKGYSQLLKSAGPLNENQIDFIQRIQNAAEHMRELVENVLDLAKMDLGAEKKHEVLDLALIVHELADEFRPQAEGKGQTLRLEDTGSSSKVMGDALKIRQALRNLIGNAIKYTPEGGDVSLALEPSADAAKVHIRDTGYGIPADALPHLFKRFYRVRNSGHDIEGNGLGLSIVKSIAEEHGGEVNVESEPGKGSCFTLSLPLHHSEIVTAGIDPISAKNEILS